VTDRDRGALPETPADALAADGLDDSDATEESVGGRDAGADAEADGLIDDDREASAVADDERDTRVDVEKTADAVDAPLDDDVAVGTREKDVLVESDGVAVNRADADDDSQNETAAVAVIDANADALGIVTVAAAEFDSVATRFVAVAETNDDAVVDCVTENSTDADEDASSDGEAPPLIDIETGALAVRESLAVPVAACVFERVGVGVAEAVARALDDGVWGPLRVNATLCDAAGLSDELRVSAALIDAAAERVKDVLSVDEMVGTALDDELAELAALALSHPLADGEPEIAEDRLGDADRDVAADTERDERDEDEPDGLPDAESLECTECVTVMDTVADVVPVHIVADCRAVVDDDPLTADDTELEAVVDGDDVVLLEAALLADAVSVQVPPVAVT
jgi:hypothetical protein